MEGVACCVKLLLWRWGRGGSTRSRDGNNYLCPRSEKNGQYEAAISVWDDLIHRFGALQNPTIQQRVAVALFDKGDDLDTLNHHEAAISVYDDLLHRFGGSKIWQFNDLWRRL